MSPDSSHSPKDLFSRIASGDEAAFGELFHLWRDKLYYYILRITNSPEMAEDILQDVFVKLWVNRKEFVDFQNFEGYFYKMCQNRAISGMRRMAQETLILAELRKEPATFGLAVDEILNQKELNKELQEIIRRLPNQQRQVYSLCREQGLKHEEIAGILKISASTVKNHLTIALRTIRQELSRDYRTTTLCFLLAIAFALLMA
ncbi:RNA polymerase sigma factor [Flavitalea flava]